ncbi:MAG TPA: hypothetical protein ENJ82_16820, partial [Bacteroidetes bacterium]|nr:hypothetical protein [Bacteroidota bacterium]
MNVRKFILKHIRWILFGFIPLLTFLMHLHIFPTELVGTHAWRQCETASNVANFYDHSFAITDPHVYQLDFPEGLKRMEFPIMQWGMALAYDIFGPSVVVLRIFSWLIGLFSIWGMFYLIRALFDDKWIAIAGAWCFAFSPVFFYYSVNPLPDNLALAAGIWGAAGFVLWHRGRNVGHLWLAATMLML